MDSESAIIKPENKPFIATRFLPKTGQTTVYAANDDGDFKKGWAIGERFVLTGQVVYDRATGLEWPKRWSVEGAYNGNQQNWAQAVAWAAALIFDGYSDWRLPNVHELYSLVDFESLAPTIHNPPFVYVAEDCYWTSTTRKTNTANAFCVLFTTGATSGGRPKTGTEHCVAVRRGSPW